MIIAISGKQLEPLKLLHLLALHGFAWHLARRGIRELGSRNMGHEIGSHLLLDMQHNLA